MAGKGIPKKLNKMTCQDVLAAVTKKKAASSGRVPKDIEKSKIVHELKIGGYPYYTVLPKNDFSGDYIFFLYDSKLCFAMDDAQWKFVSDMVDCTEMGFLIPMYPLAPEHSCEDVYPMLIAAYHDAAVTCSGHKLILMGEGVGALFALSLTLQAWKEGLRTPDQMLFLSPALDTEFFDQKLAATLSVKYNKGDIYFTPAIAEFINQYWVKQNAGDMEKTSPVYEDYADLCEDIYVFSGTNDVLNGYARYFCNKVNESGTKVKYFEYHGMPHQFYLDMKHDESLHCRKVLKDAIRGEKKAIFNQYMYEVKQRSDWTKQYPEIFKDDLAVKFILQNKIDFKMFKKQSSYHQLISAARQRSIDNGVRLFLQEYPNGTVVHLGCSLDTMFERTDNGRVNWYNCDSPGTIAVRRMYVPDNERITTIDKSVHDLSWMSDIDVDMGYGLLFVFSNTLTDLTKEEVMEFMAELYEHFPGAQVLFDATTKRSAFYTNVYNKGKDVDYRKRRFYMNNPEKELSYWNTVYKVVRQDAILGDIKLNTQWNVGLKSRVVLARIMKDYKLVYARLGNEKYKTNFMVDLKM